MTDLLERLAARNPVDEQTLEIPATLAYRVFAPPPPRRRPRARRWVAAVAIAAAAVIVAVLAIPGSQPRVDAAAAYRAVAPGAGITHWRETITSPSGVQQIAEGWKTATVAHVVSYDVVGGRPQLTGDTRTADGHQVDWSRETGDVQTGPDIPGDQGSIPIDVDPAGAFRRAYRDHTLRQVDATTFTIAIPPCCTGIYHLDPQTGLPRQYVSRDNVNGATTVDITTYEHEPATTANLANLDSLPRPPLKLRGTAEQEFAVLRGGAPLTGADRALVGHAVGHLKSDMGYDGASLDTVRALTPDTWLVPAGKHLCVADRVMGTAIAMGCTTLAYAETHGVNVNGVMAVPDGTTSVEITYEDGTRQAFPVRDGIAEFAGGAIASIVLR